MLIACFVGFRGNTACMKAELSSFANYWKFTGTSDHMGEEGLEGPY